MRSISVFGVLLVKNVGGFLGEKTGRFSWRKGWKVLLAKRMEGSFGEKPGRLEKNLPGLDLGCQHDFGVLYFEIWCLVFSIRFSLGENLEGALGEKPGRLEKNLPGLDLGCQHDFLKIPKGFHVYSPRTRKR